MSAKHKLVSLTVFLLKMHLEVFNFPNQESKDLQYVSIVKHVSDLCIDVYHLYK